MSSYLNQFNYQLFGPEDGPKWVFVHGLLGYGLNWRKIVSGLQGTQRCLVYDQRGHGKSFKPATGYSPEDYADDLFLITEELGWSKFTLVGHSMGGRNSIVFAHKFPQKLERLVIEDIGPESDPAAVDYYRNLFNLVPTPFTDKQSAKQFFLNKFPALSKNLGQPDTLGAYLYSNIIELQDGRADWRFSKEAMISTVYQGRSKPYWQEFKSIEVPTLVIRGEHSNELKKSVYQEMLRSNSHAKGVEIPDAGHWVHADKPELFLRALQSFARLPEV